MHQSGGSQNDLVTKNEQSLVENARKKLIDKMQASIHEQTKSIPNNVMITKWTLMRSNPDTNIVQAQTKQTHPTVDATKAIRKQSNHNPHLQRIVQVYFRKFD